MFKAGSGLCSRIMRSSDVPVVQSASDQVQKYKKFWNIKKETRKNIKIQQKVSTTTTSVQRLMSYTDMGTMKLRFLSMEVTFLGARSYVSYAMKW